MTHCCLESIELHQLNEICSSLYSQITHLPRETVDASLLEVFKARSDGALSNQVMAEGLEVDDL